MIKAGDKVWGVRFSFGQAMISSAIVEKVTAKTVKLAGNGEPGFGYKHLISHNEAHTSKLAALEVLSAIVRHEIGHAEIALDKLRAVRDANMAAIAEEKMKQAPEDGHAA